MNTNTRTPPFGPPPRHGNFFAEDPDIAGIIAQHRGDDFAHEVTPLLSQWGRRVAEEVDFLAALADKHPPVLEVRDRWGNPSGRLQYHPAYEKLKAIAYPAGLVWRAFETGADGTPDGRLLSMTMGYVFGQAEAGLFCPICMTDGVARVLTQSADASTFSEAIQRLTARSLENLAEGAMFLTEQAGGSDVGAAETIAEPVGPDTVRLTGHKWFCSNADAAMALTLGRPVDAPAGTAGLGLYLLERKNGTDPANGIWLRRIKDKLGVRSMATGEIELERALAKVVAPAGQGFKRMAEMMNLSRLYNAVAAVALARRALYEATHAVAWRSAFGRPVIQFPLLEGHLADLSADLAAGLRLTFAAVDALDRADRGEESARLLVRVLIPMVKHRTAIMAVHTTQQAMEMLGGNGYIEDFPLARVHRDALVLPIWEGTAQILMLDTLRAMSKDGVGDALAGFIGERIESLDGGPLADLMEPLGRTAGALQKAWSALSWDPAGRVSARLAGVAEGTERLLEATVLAAAATWAATGGGVGQSGSAGASARKGAKGHGARSASGTPGASGTSKPAAAPRKGSDRLIALARRYFTRHLETRAVWERPDDPTGASGKEWVLAVP